MSISAKVSWPHNYFVVAIGWVSEYFKDTLFIKTLVLCDPK
jgi:hypothetical protein